MSPLLRETLTRPRSALREAWQAVRQRRIAHPLFVRPSEVWSYALDEPHAAQRYDTVEAWCAAHRQFNAYLVVSGHATHEVVVKDDNTLPLHDAGAVVAWAAQQFVRRHGTAAQQWPVAPWQAAGRHGATAIHGLDLRAAEESAQAHKVRLRAVHTWWPVALAAAMRQQPELGAAPRWQLFIAEGRLLTRVACSEGTVADVEQCWLERPSLPALRQLLQQLVPSGPGADASVLLGYGIDGATPGAVNDLPVRTLGALDGACPAYAWVMF